MTKPERRTLRSDTQSTFHCFDPLNEDDWHICLRGLIDTSKTVHSILDLNEKIWGSESISIAISCWLTEWQGLCLAVASEPNNSPKRAQVYQVLAEREVEMMRILGRLQRAAKRGTRRCQ